MKEPPTKKVADDDAMQKSLGMTAQEWRDATERSVCARSLWWSARCRASAHTAAAADASKAMLHPARNGMPLRIQDVVTAHRRLTETYSAIANAHEVVATQAMAEADTCAKELISELTPIQVSRRLGALGPAMAAAITRLFGDDLSDARTRARVFEACDFAQWEGGIDEAALTSHRGISKTRKYV